MEEQRKFKFLKNKLEAMNYYQNLSYDSLPLVEALLSDIINLNSSLSRVRLQKSDPEAIRELSERIDYLKREKQSLEDEIKRTSIFPSSIEKENLSLTVEDLKRENKVLTQKIQNYQPNRSEQREQVDKLYSDFNFIKQQLEASEENVQKLNFENKCLQDRLRSAESQVTSLRKDLDVSSMTIKEITNENRSTTEEYYTLKKVIASYEAKVNYYEEELNSLRVESQKSCHFNRGLEQQISSLNKELSKNRSELEMSSSIKTRISSQLESVQRQLDIVQSENTKLHNLRDEDKIIISDLEEKFAEMEVSYRTLQEKLRVVQRESQGFCEVIREKGEELRMKEQSKKNIEKELKELRNITVKFDDSVKENHKLRDNNENLNQDIISLQTNIRDLQMTIKTKDEDYRNLRNSLESTNKDLESLKSKLEDEKNKNFNLNSSLRQAEKTEDNLRTTKAFLEESEKRERRQQTEIDQLQSMLQKNEEKLSLTQRNLESFQNNFQTSQLEISKLQKSIVEVSSKENCKAIELSRYETIFKNNSAEIEDLKRKILELEHCKHLMADQLRESQKLLSTEQNNVYRQSDQILHLKDLVASLENSRSEVIKKIDLLQSNDMEKESMIQRLREDLASLRKLLSQNEKNLAENIHDREKLFKDLDSFKYEISRKSEENSAILNNLKRANSEVEELRKQVKIVQENEDNFKRSWRDSEIEKMRVHEINMAINLQLDDLKKNCNKYLMQIQDISRDFNANDNRLKALEDKYSQVIFENENILKKNEEITRELRAKCEMLNAMSRDKDDLIVKIRNISDAYEQLVRAYDYLNLDFKKLSGKASATEGMNEGFKKQEDLYIRKIEELEGELRNLIRTCEMAEYKRLEAEKTAEALLKMCRGRNV